MAGKLVKKLTSFEKIIGILFHPKDTFQKLKNENMADSFQLYTSLMLIITTAAFFFSVLFYNTTAAALRINLPLYFTFLLLIYLAFYLFTSLCIPSLVVSSYYMFLKILFKMDIKYDQCFKAIIYPMIQLWIFSVVSVLILSIIYKLDSLITIIIGFTAALLILVYNMATEIQGLFILCNVKKQKAFLMILSQAILVFLFFIIVFFISKLFFPSMQNL